MSKSACAVSVVLPTYNESENLPKIVPLISLALETAGITFEIIVMDDHSPDGTYAVALELGKNYPVRAVDRVGKTRGLSAAVIDGFELASGVVVAVMDADMSHPIDVLPQMVASILAGDADIAVGSRNILGGGSVEWPWYRRLISNTAALMTLGITPMTDPTTGYMAVRKSLLNFDRYNPIGWKIVLEIVAKHPEASLKEFPILFQDRQFGKSKMSLKEQGAYIQHLLRLYESRWPGVAEFIRFGLVGGSGIVVDMAGSSTLLWLLSTSYGAIFQANWAVRESVIIAASALGFSLALTSNFFLNRAWSFRHGRDLPLGNSYLKYFAVNSIGLWLRIAVVSIVAFFASSPGILQAANIIGISVACGFNFFGVKFWAFKKSGVASGQLKR